MIWSVFSKVAQSNARYNAMDRLIVVVQSVTMPVGFGRKSIKSKGRPLDVAANVKKVSSGLNPIQTAWPTR